jgi:hypothetical protein
MTSDKLELFVLSPDVIFKARIAQSTFTYPISQVSYNQVTVGNYALLERGLTVLFGTTEGADDLGRGRIGPNEATATVIYFGRSSEGTNDGEVSLVDNAYITVINDFRVWSKIPFITEGITMYKDGSIPVEDRTTLTPPVANAGVPAIGTVDAISGVLRVRLPSGAQTSFVTYFGATITDYVWELPTGVALVAGYNLTDSFIEVDCDPGFYWIALAVVDSNGKGHQARTWILARDPDNDVMITGFEVVSHRRTREGQSLEVTITQNLPVGSYPDGTLVALIDDEPASSADRENILFWGWHLTDPASISASRTGIVKNTRLLCVDVAGKLATLPGFPQMLENDDVRDTAKFPNITWAHMPNLNLDLFIHYILYWHSTALEVTDYLPTLTGSVYSIGGAIISDGGNLWEQVRRRGSAYVPARNIGCDRFGRIVVRADPFIENPANRTTEVNAALTANDWSDLRWTYQRSPRVHWLHGSAIQAVDPLPIVDGEFFQPTFFCIAPGTSPGQGGLEDTIGEQLSPSQTYLNDSTGHHYARMNARESLFDIDLVGSPFKELDPAVMEWVTLTLDAAYAAQRGLSFTAARGLIHEVDYGYRSSRTGLVKTVHVRWERETVGRPALTVTKPDIPKAGDSYVPDIWIPPLPGDPTVWFAPIKGYIFWDGAHVMRTWDVLAASPVWELVDTGITGSIIDGVYVHVDATTVGMWVLTTAGPWWCADIMATTPSWSLKLPLATVITAEEQIVDYPTRFNGMAIYGSEPGYLILTTSPSGFSIDHYNYQHAYSWHTHDFGANWTHVDMSEFLETTLGYTCGYAWSDKYSIACFASSPVVWIVRNSSGLHKDLAVFRSDDGGHTWTKGHTLHSQVSPSYMGTIVAPFPSIDGYCYFTNGSAGADWPWLFASTDGFATATQRDKPAGYTGIGIFQRPNRRTFVPEHVIAIFRRDSDGSGIVMESEDAGVTWAVLFETTTSSISFQTPNGWPPDIDVWFFTKSGGDTNPIADAIRYTDDRFVTTADKSGNMTALVGDLVLFEYGSSGFALPKVGVNA